MCAGVGYLARNKQGEWALFPNGYKNIFSYAKIDVDRVTHWCRMALTKRGMSPTFLEFSKMSNSIRCTCCQALLTAPQFHNGYAYGWTCIKKVDPSFKQTKTVYVACEAFKVVQAGQRSVVNVKINGKWKQVVVYGHIESRTTSTYMQEGVMFIAEDKVK